MRWPARWRRGAPEQEAPGGVIVHYHIYKNAGSSIDRLLSECFGAGWQAFDPMPGTNPARQADLAAFIAATPGLRAVSSHSTRLAWPGLPHPLACPIVMLRHPIERVRSVYDFARRDPAQPDHKAASGSFYSYVEHRLGLPDRSGIANHQVAHLSKASLRSAQPWFAEPVQSDLDDAMALLSGWPAFGLVERFADSMAIFLDVYGPRVRGLRLGAAHENSRPRHDVDALSARSTEELLGPAIFQRLMDANGLDIALHDFACRVFESRFAAPSPV